MQEIQERPYGATDETTVLEVYVALGTSQTCRGCRGNWKLGSLEAWKLGFLVVQLFRLSPACRAFCSPFSVLRSPGRESAPAPHQENQASKPPNFQASIVRPACDSTPLICTKSVKSAVSLRRFAAVSNQPISQSATKKAARDGRPFCVLPGRLSLRSRGGRGSRCGSRRCRWWPRRCRG